MRISTAKFIATLSAVAVIFTLTGGFIYSVVAVAPSSTGAIFGNGVALQWKDSGGTARNAIWVDSANNLQFGTSGIMPVMQTSWLTGTWTNSPCPAGQGVTAVSGNTVTCSAMGAVKLASKRSTPLTQTGDIAATTTGLNVSLLANTNYQFTATIFVTTGAATVTAVDFQIPALAAGATLIQVGAVVGVDTATSRGGYTSSTATNIIVSIISIASKSWTVILTGVITVGANPATLQINFITSGTGTTSTTVADSGSNLIAWVIT